ncbi:uncharacterized protein LOC126693979 [Quercus robur]|uniref:uncharacterized protein LOC126693979 n=1 Tax=Quercus robur TaxID=38942 RepID=UPI00216316E8|nr:uncharacterized protein LOC126693979 [Quercus robur]
MLQKAMKSVSRNRFLLCFRPVVDMEGVLQAKSLVDSSASQGLPFISVENKEETKVSMSPKPTFSRVVKAVMFGTILNKRVRDRKRCHQDSYQSKRGLSMNYDRNRASVDNTNSGLSHSSSYASSDSSSCSGSISESKNSSIITNETCSKNQELEEKPEKVDMLDCSSFNSGIYLLVISLIITILLGKLCAIIFTSILVYFVPRQRYDRQEDVIRLAKPKSRDYRKGVIP